MSDGIKKLIKATKTAMSRLLRPLKLDFIRAKRRIARALGRKKPAAANPVRRRQPRFFARVFAKFSPGRARLAAIGTGALAAVVLLGLLIGSLFSKGAAPPSEEAILDVAPSASFEAAQAPISVSVSSLSALSSASGGSEERVPAARTLYSRGYEGPIVSEIQLRLMELGYMDYDEPTELYGPATQAAVEAFQRRNGLPITGELNESDYALLMSEDALLYMVTEGDEGTDVSEIQKRLIELGYLQGKPTGYFGSDTKAAVIAFQENNRLSVDGMVGTETKEAFYGEDAVPRSITYGEKSEEVKQIQERLFKLGYMTSEPDGNFGADTKAAVKLFQQKNGLIVDGYVGPATKALLNSNDAQANALSLGDSGVTVERVQAKLKKLGYLKKATGYYGSDTEYAVRAFQKRNDLTVDGKVGRKTMAALLADNAKGPSSSYKLPGSGSSGSGSSSSGSGGSSSGSSGGKYADTSGASLDTFIKVALSKQGSKYVTGAKGPNTFDCSGFVYWCLNQAGVKQSYMTSKAWRSVSKYQRIDSLSSLKRGDVIVFRMSSSSGHVAIALGDGTMVHAGSTKGCVYVSSYNTDYWRKYFYCAYRIF